jgi:Zn-dependent protease with chaperone function
VQSSWLVLDLLGEARAMLALLFDRRYHMAWLTRVTAVVLLVAVFTSGWWFPLTLLPFIGGYLDKLFDLCLALLLFLLLSREVRRYREWRAGRR